MVDVPFHFILFSIYFRLKLSHSYSLFLRQSLNNSVTCIFEYVERKFFHFSVLDAISCRVVFVLKYDDVNYLFSKNSEEISHQIPPPNKQNEPTLTVPGITLSVGVATTQTSLFVLQCVATN